MKRILFPTDFSEAAVKASLVATSLAQEQGAQLLILHAFAPPEVFAEAGTVYMQQNMERLQHDIDLRLGEVLGDLKEHAPDLDIIKISHVGFPSDVICKEALEEPDTVIVMGTEGASGLKKMLMGSVTARVIEAAPCPVIAIPDNDDPFELKRIVYATNYQSEELEALRRVVDIAKSYNAEVVVLHVAEEDNELIDDVFSWYETVVREAFPESKLSFKLLPPAPLQEALAAFAKDCKASMLAMSRRERGLLGRLFTASESKKMAYHSQCPLLVFHTENLQPDAAANNVFENSGQTT
ncbi:MAG: universal stress protein [Bacteroidia bacterium]